MEDVKVLEDDVRPRGYDTYFWSPHMDDDFGGSNAVEIMCSTNDVFDHQVIVNSKGEDGKKSECENYVWMRTC